MYRDIERRGVNEGQIPGKKIEPQRPLLDTLSIPGDSSHDWIQVGCRCCGKFLINGTLIALWDVGNSNNVSEDDFNLRRYLSAYTRQTSTRGTISRLDEDNWRDFARAHQTTQVSQKINTLLELVANYSAYPGDEAHVDIKLDYPLLDAASKEEGLYLLEALINRNDLTILGSLTSRATEYTCIVTPNGWQRLEPPVGGGGIPGRCFIAMSFDPSLDDAYELGIRPAVIVCGAEPRRLDRVHHNEKICDRILAEIRLSQFIVADFTFHRGGVYFEAGFALALARPVIWTCRADHLKDTHFDTRQYNHIVWETPDELKNMLTDRIRATIF